MSTAGWRWAAAALALLAGLLLLPRLLLIGVPFQLNYNEGWNLYRVALVQAGARLYGAAPDLWVANYPPLSFHLAALVDRMVGDLVLTGRLLALAGLAATTTAVAAVVHRLTRQRWIALSAALLVPIWIGLYQASRIAMNDPQLMATGLIGFGVYAYLRAGHGGWLAASAMAFALGLAAKHNLFDLPLAVAMHMLLGRRWRAAALWAGCLLASGLSLLLLFLHLDGPHLVAHVLTARDYLPWKGVRMAGGFLAYFGGALLLAAWWARGVAATGRRGTAAVALVTCGAVGLVLAPGNGLDRNNFFDTLVALAIVCGLAWTTLGQRGLLHRPLVLAAAVALPLMPAVAKLPERLADGLNLLRAAPARSLAFESGRRLLARARPPAVCENLQLCFAAGQPLDYEPFYLDDRMRRGLLDPTPIAALLRAQHWGAIVLDSGPDAELHPGRARERFAAPLVDAMLAAYFPAYSAHDFVILLPRDGMQPTAR